VFALFLGTCLVAAAATLLVPVLWTVVTGSALPFPGENRVLAGPGDPKPGDLDCDGTFTLKDIAPFVKALKDKAGWQQQYQKDLGYLLKLADFNHDGALGTGDIKGFCVLIKQLLDRGEDLAGGRPLGDGGRVTCSVDLDIDSDNNNGTDFPDRTQQEEDDEGTESKYVAINDDDDDVNLVPDYAQESPILEEYGELVPLVLEVQCDDDPPPCTMTFPHEGKDKVHIWSSPLREGEVSGDSFPMTAHLLGDMNCNGELNPWDADPFVLALVDADEYQSRYPDCEILRADFNYDFALTSSDIDPFIACLTGTSRIARRFLWIEEQPLHEGDYSITAQLEGTALSDVVKAEPKKCTFTTPDSYYGGLMTMSAYLMEPTAQPSRSSRAAATWARSDIQSAAERWTGTQRSRKADCP
jgi:hypothetical protein